MDAWTERRPRLASRVHVSAVILGPAVQLGDPPVSASSSFGFLYRFRFVPKFSHTFTVSVPFAVLSSSLFALRSSLFALSGFKEFCGSVVLRFCGSVVLAPIVIGGGLFVRTLG